MPNNDQPPPPRRGPGRPPRDPSTHKVQVGIKLPPDVLDRLRNAVAWSDGTQTVNGFIERAAVRALELLEEGHGGPFPPRAGRLPRSRRGPAGD